MNELFKSEKIFEREIENLDFYEVLWKKTILWLYGVFVSLCVFARCVNYVRYVSYVDLWDYVFASWLPSPGKKHIPVLFNELDDDDCNFDRNLTKGSDILNFICDWVVLFVCKSMLARPFSVPAWIRVYSYFVGSFDHLLFTCLGQKGEWGGVRAINFMAINISS